MSVIRLLPGDLVEIDRSGLHLLVDIDRRTIGPSIALGSVGLVACCVVPRPELNGHVLVMVIMGDKVGWVGAMFCRAL